jgi:hypothetical protein
MNKAKSEKESPSYDLKFSNDNFRELSNKITKDDSFKVDDIPYLNAGILRLSDDPKNINGKSVRQVIEEQKAFERTLHNANLKKVGDLAIAKLNTTNKFVGSSVDDKENMQRNVLHFEFENKYYEDILGISGNIIFVFAEENMPAHQLQPIPFHVNQKIKALSTETIPIIQPFAPNDAISNLVRLRTPNLVGILQLSDIQFADTYKD